MVAMRAALDVDMFDAAWAHGQVLPLEQAVALALEDAYPKATQREH
jgi:hypothetical protein